MLKSVPCCTWLLLCVSWISASTSVIAQNSSSYYVEAGTFSTRRESDPPAYVQNLGEHLGSQWQWLDFGLEQRMRQEFRDDDIRRPVSTSRDTPLLRRTRAWLGAHRGPLGFTVEFTDSRRGNSHFAADNREVNEHEFIQAYAELRFNDLLAPDPQGNKRPLYLRAGRQAFELLDRRLVARNEWRNTTNNFDGLRASIGQDSNNWQVELLSLHPVTRLLGTRDKRDSKQQFDALIGHWRTGSPLLTLEPHLLRLQDDSGARDIRATGLRVYGRTTDSVINYDVSVLNQHGTVGTLQHAATGFTAEAGYTFVQHPWRPRVSLFYGHADGDEAPADTEANRFERFFGFGRPWSANEYFIYENLQAPKLKLEFQPTSALRVDFGYGAFWLASATDRASNLPGGAGNRDPQGRSGTYLGGEWDARVRFSAGSHVDATIGYAHFKTGEFVRARQQAALGGYANDSDFFYLELVLGVF